MKIIFGGGGSGGHIVPALAVAEVFRGLGADIAFVGNINSMEEHLCHAAKIPFYWIKVQKLYRNFTWKHLLFPYHFAASTLKARYVLKVNRPDAVFCTGGFVSGPLALAAINMNIPLFFHESNSYPGLTTKLFASRCQRVYTAFDSVAKHLKGARTHKVGIPILPFSSSEMPVAWESLNLNPHSSKIIIVGGSQGSAAINSCISEILDDLLQMGLEVIWQTGKSTFHKYKALHQNRKGLYIFDFCTFIPQLYHNAQLAITRAGAMTIAELENAKLPSLLIPLPTSAENHQYYNAQEQVAKGFSLLLEQKDLSPQSLLGKIQELKQKHSSIQTNMRAIGKNLAAEHIAHDINKHLNKEQHNVR